METAIVYCLLLGLYGDTGKSNGSYYNNMSCSLNSPKDDSTRRQAMLKPEPHAYNDQHLLAEFLAGALVKISNVIPTQFQKSWGRGTSILGP